MNWEQALDVINGAVFNCFGRQLSSVETIILAGAWQGHTYEQIAETAGYSVAYLMRDAGVKCWKVLSQALEQPVSKKNLRFVVEHYAATSILPDPLAESLSTTSVDWGDAPNPSFFYGRVDELNQLQQWLLGLPGGQETMVQPCCRLVALLGIGGIGKTALAIKFAQQVQSQFDIVIWRSLRNAPPLETLLTDWVLFLSQQQDSQADLSRLLYYLRSRRCLLILDNVETVFQEGDRAGHYRPDYEDYGELFKLVGETVHQSCLILTSREKPAEVAALEDNEWVRSLCLNGSTEAAQRLIEARELFGSEQHKQTLANRYGNNPLAIRIVTSSIQDIFDGDIEQFLQQDTILFNGLRRLLEQQFERLSYLEKTVMYWLAINREWTAIADLAEDIVPAVSRAALLEALESLTWRSLIEKRLGRYTQQPTVMEYVTDHLIEQVVRELVAQKILVFDRYALVKMTVKDYIYQTQVRLIVEPITSKLRATFSDASLIQHLRIVVERLHTVQEPSTYSSGNLINLLRYLQFSLADYDFSQLSITHADLRGLELQHINFQGATLAKTIFTQDFGIIFSVAFSPDGQLLATGDDNGQIHFWNASDSQPILSIQAHDSWIKSIAWSPDGQQLVSSSADHQIKLWNPLTGDCQKILQGHMAWIRSITWSQDGQRLVSGSADQTVRIWDVQTGYSTVLSHQSSIWAVTWSPDGTRVASGGDDCTVKIWDIETGTCLTSLRGHGYGIKSLAWSIDGRSLASGSDDQTVRLWDIETGNCLKTLQGHTGSIWSIAWSPVGKFLATSSHDQTVRVWDTNTGHCLQLLQGHTNWVWSVCWNPDGTILATGSHDQTIKLWNAETGVCLRTLQGYNSQVRSVSFSPDGQFLASGSMDQQVRLWDLNEGNQVNALQGHSNAIVSVAWSPDGQLLASAAHDQTVRLWNIQTRHCVRILRGHTSFIWSVAWSPDGQTLATTSADLTVRLWNLQGDCIHVLRGHLGWVFAIAWSVDGQLLASGGADNVVRFWNPQTGELAKELEGHTNWVWSVAWNPDQSLLASSSGDGTIRLWHPQTGKCIRVLEEHTNWISAIAWSPDGQFIASGSAAQMVKLWHIESGQCLQVFKGHTRQVTSISFRADGKVLTSGSEDGTIKLWDIATGQCLRTLRADRPYEGMNITGVIGLTEGQKVTLKALGAVEHLG